MGPWIWHCCIAYWQECQYNYACSSYRSCGILWLSIFPISLDDNFEYDKSSLWNIEIDYMINRVSLQSEFSQALWLKRYFYKKKARFNLHNTRNDEFNQRTYRTSAHHLKKNYWLTHVSKFSFSQKCSPTCSSNAISTPTRTSSSSSQQVDCWFSQELKIVLTIYRRLCGIYEQCWRLPY